MIEPKVGLRVIGAQRTSWEGLKGTIYDVVEDEGNYYVDFDNAAAAQVAGLASRGAWSTENSFDPIPDEEAISPTYSDTMIGRVVRWIGGGPDKTGAVMDFNATTGDVRVGWVSGGNVDMIVYNIRKWQRPLFVLVKDVAKPTPVASKFARYSGNGDPVDTNKVALMKFFSAVPQGHCPCNTPRNVCWIHRDSKVA